MELDDNVEELPGLDDARAKVEQALKDLLSILNPELGDVTWMPIAWFAGVEAIGYNEGGRKFRAIEHLAPRGQGLSASSGISDLAINGYVSAVADAMNEEDED